MKKKIVFKNYSANLLYQLFLGFCCFLQTKLCLNMFYNRLKLSINRQKLIPFLSFRKSLIARFWIVTKVQQKKSFQNINSNKSQYQHDIAIEICMAYKQCTSMDGRQAEKRNSNNNTNWNMNGKSQQIY